MPFTDTLLFPQNDRMVIIQLEVKTLTNENDYMNWYAVYLIKGPLMKEKHYGDLS